MPEAERVRVAVVGGSGGIGLRHARIVSQSPVATLCAIVDPSPAGSTVAAELGVPHYLDVSALLAARSTNGVGAAIVATPNSTHAPIAVQLLDESVSIIVEKPIAAEEAGARAILEAERRAVGRAHLIVGHHRRFNPFYLRAKEAIDGKLGVPLGFSELWACRKNAGCACDSAATQLTASFDVPWRIQAGSGGPLAVNMSHSFDALAFIFSSRIVRVFAQEGRRTRPHAVEETLAITLSLENGVVGTVFCSDAALSPHFFEAATGENPSFPKSSQTALTVFGTQGTISVPDLRRWHSTRPDGGDWTQTLEADDSLAQGNEFSDLFAVQLEHFARVIAGVEPPRCSGADGLAAVLVVEAVAESLRTGLPIDVKPV